MKKERINIIRYIRAKYALIVLFSIFNYTAISQQDAQYTQYMYNTQTVNPAYTGSRGVFEIFTLARGQWIGIDGAPQTLNFNLNSPVGLLKQVGLGLNFYKDKIGPANENQLTGDFSYAINLTKDIKLAFGIKGGVNLMNIDYEQLNIFDESDALQQVNIRNRVTPVAGLGIYLHNDKNWYVGISAPNLLETKYFTDQTLSQSSERINVYTIAGYVFEPNQNFKLKPAILGKFVSGAPVAIDFSLNTLYRNKVILGLAYRLNTAVSGLLAFQITNRFLMGYAYDYGLQALANYSVGSHELMFRFDFNLKTPGRLVTPRFF